MTLLGDRELAVAQGVPELDGLVARAGNDLTVIGREGDGENVVVVADEAPGSLTGGELPETESVIPGGGESVGAVAADNAVRDDVGVALEGTLGDTVGGIVAGQVPDDEGLVATAGEQHVGAAEEKKQKNRQLAPWCSSIR